MPSAPASPQTSAAPDFTIHARGPFSLEESATFGFGQRAATVFDGVMRLAFCVDGYDHQVGVAVRQDAEGVHGWISADAPDGAATAAVQRQVARVLSLDYDGGLFEAVGERDPVIAQLQAIAPGLRPPLFYSPYEAAAWCVLSARRPAAQMSELRRRLSEAHGCCFEVAGSQLAALPTPRQMLAVEQFPGLPPEKLRRLHVVARSALEGGLDASSLASMDGEGAERQLRRLEGIGPFYSSLIMIRSTGLADQLPEAEPKLLALVAELYALSGPPEPAQLEAIAEPWRPLRTWAAVLIRAAGARRRTSLQV